MQTHYFQGFTIQFPEEWEAIEQEETEPTLTIQSLETAFWMLKIFKDAPVPQEVLTTAADAVCDEYDNVDVYNVEVDINGKTEQGIDLEFVCFDLLCAASLRAFQLNDMTMLIYSQWADQEIEIVKQPLESITDSLEYNQV